MESLDELMDYADCDRVDGWRRAASSHSHVPDPLTAALADGPLVLRSWIELADALAPDPSTPPTIIHPSARITLASRGSRAGPVDIVHGIDLRVFAVEGTPTSTVLHDLERLL